MVYPGILQVRLVILPFAVYWTLVVWPASPYLLPPHGKKDIRQTA